MVPMAWSRKVSIAHAIAFLIVVGSVAAAGRAQAQMISAPPIFPVEISATQPGTRIHLYGPGGHTNCGERCALTLPQAQYKMVVSDAEGHNSTQYLLVQMPTSATVTPADLGKRNLGIVLMSVGLAVIVVSGAIFYAILFEKWVETAGDCGDPNGCATHDFATSTYVIAGASLGAGLTLGLTGLSVWLQHHHATVRVDPLGAPSAASAFPDRNRARQRTNEAWGARLLLTPAAGHRWAGLALTGGF